MNGRVSFIPNQSFKSKHGGGAAAAKMGENKRRFFQIWSLKLPNGSRFSPARFLRHIGTKVEVAFQYVSSRRRCSRKVSSASFTRSRSYAGTLDSQRAEAIEDCIDFLNSSSACMVVQQEVVHELSCCKFHLQLLEVDMNNPSQTRKGPHWPEKGYKSYYGLLATHCCNQIRYLRVFRIIPTLQKQILANNQYLSSNAFFPLKDDGGGDI